MIMIGDCAMLKTFVNGLLTLLLLAGTALAQTAPERIRISYSSGGMTSIDLFIARDLKYFQQQNLSAELIRVPANLAITAGISGDIDVLGSIGSAIRSIQRGTPLKVISVTLRRPLFFLVARPEYKSIKELKGKTSASSPSAAASTPRRNGCWHCMDSTPTKS
jgi:ABC-type nitrate/sulfonate/bicarbonate transport system substrate-binding protein